MFKGAESNAFNASWETSNDRSPDFDLSNCNSLKTLVGRSRQLIKDNPVVSGLQQAFVVSIVGVGPQIYITENNTFKNNQINKFVEDFISNCDISGTQSLVQILENIVSCCFEDGDVLINLPMDGNTPTAINTKVELIESHRIKNPPADYNKEITGLLRNGVEYYKGGSIKGYWVVNEDQVDKGFASKEHFTFYPVYRESAGFRRKVTFLFRALTTNRPLSSRQYPMTTPLISLFKMLDDFNEAVLIGARVAACFSAFVKINDPIAGRKAMTKDSITGEENSVSGKKFSKLSPGSIFYMRPGEEITFADPNKPSDNTDALTLRSHKTLAMALRMPYIIAFLDTEAVSYSSWRGAVVEGQKNTKRWVRELNKVIDWIIKTALAEAELKELIRPINQNTFKIRNRWPAVGVLDPEKEDRGNKISLANGTKSQQMICDEQGTDYDEVYQDRLVEAKNEIELEAERLKLRKELSKKYDIVFEEDQAMVSSERDSKLRPGEKTSPKKDPETAKERRKDDGNW